MQVWMFHQLAPVCFLRCICNRWSGIRCSCLKLNPRYSQTTSVWICRGYYLLYYNLILRSAELNFRKIFDVIAFFAYTIAFRNNFCYFFRISFYCPKSCSLYFCYQSGMSVIASIIEKDDISFFRGSIGWKRIRKITAGNKRPIF